MLSMNIFDCPIPPRYFPNVNLRAASFGTRIQHCWDLQKYVKEADKLDCQLFDPTRDILGDNHIDTHWSAHALGWDLEPLSHVEPTENLHVLPPNVERSFFLPRSLFRTSVTLLMLRRQGNVMMALILMRCTKKKK